MVKKLSNRNSRKYDRISAIAFYAVAVIGSVDVIRYLVLGEMVSILTMIVVEALLMLTAFTAWRGRMPVLLLLAGIGSAVLFALMNNWSTSRFNLGFLLQSLAAFAGAAVGLFYAVRERRKPGPVPWIPILTATVLSVAELLTWMLQVGFARQASGPASAQLWAVPEVYDAQICGQAGTVTTITYQTKAYGTDERSVEKRAYVYLPYGYDETKQYDILYLMHGTGDDESYWLEDHAYNKTMVDHMIAAGDIAPLIIVTPTFYVEDDCQSELDVLTYSFAQELRCDLMPAVESVYSTYAESCDPEGFAASREHRAFAGLSRGAVTMYHSAMCASLDYFAWFGAFSGSRTSAEFFSQTIQADAFRTYPIRYLYVSSGNFDFALVNQLEDYQALLELEPRLRYGENTVFDVYPMQYHSIESWHLALYNFLQKIF